MICEKCGFEVPNGNHGCPQCGFGEPTKSSPIPTNTSSLDNKKGLSTWNWLSIASLVCAVFTFFKGIHKMSAYDNGEYYPYDLVNAYVGGDAYNYIINGTYATAFFVLTAMFVLAAIGLLIVHYVSNKNLSAVGGSPTRSTGNTVM